MSYSCCFSLRETLCYLNFLQKSFVTYTIGLWSLMSNACIIRNLSIQLKKINDLQTQPGIGRERLMRRCRRSTSSTRKCRRESNHAHADQRLAASYWIRLEIQRSLRCRRLEKPGKKETGLGVYHKINADHVTGCARPVEENSLFVI